jgi:hypothetical protein
VLSGLVPAARRARYRVLGTGVGGYASAELIVELELPASLHALTFVGDQLIGGGGAGGGGAGSLSAWEVCDRYVPGVLLAIGAGWELSLPFWYPCLW